MIAFQLCSIWSPSSIVLHWPPPTAFLLDFERTTLSWIFFLSWLFFPLNPFAGSLLPYVPSLRISSPQGSVTPSQAFLTWDLQTSKLFLEFRGNLGTWIKERIKIIFLFIFNLNFEWKPQTTISVIIPVSLWLEEIEYFISHDRCYRYIIYHLYPPLVWNYSSY